MTASTTSKFKNTINSIIEEVKKLSPLEQDQILVKIRLANYLKANKKPIAKYDPKKIKPPTMEQIDKWKHESRIKK